jgi:Ca-activated chloride channel homolog
MKKTALFLLLMWFVSVCTFAQERILKGKVTDAADNQPLPGVGIFKKNTRTGTQTDAKGEFSISIKDGDMLVFSFIGYKTQNIKIAGQTVLNLKMQADTRQLQEVVVTDKAVEKRRDVTGAVSQAAPAATLYSQPGKRKTSPFRANLADEKEPAHNTEEYDAIREPGYRAVNRSPLSTFSIDVDRASYGNIRRYLQNNQMPPKDAVRIEEMVNYFAYNYPEPTGEVPFGIHTEMAACPWNPAHQLVHIGLQGKKIPTQNLPASNLTFLIDVSGSMGEARKLPLVQAAMRLLVNELREKDKVAIVVYAGAAGLVLPPTPGNEKGKILQALDNLQAGGSTAGGAGIELAYKTAQENFVKNGNNRVILATDGDFNIGMSSNGEMERLISEKRESGVFLTVLGFGMGNYKDSKMETLADKGNGNYAYIDNILEAEKVFVKEFGGTLFTIAKDVKIQVEFNPAKVKAYRLVGYENRALKDEEFNDDKKDAGELGSGHTVTALYEIIPAGSSETVPGIDELKYQKQTLNTDAVKTQEVMTVKLRYKKPDGNTSQLVEKPVIENIFSQTSDNFRWSAAVTEFGMVLRESEFRGKSSLASVLQLAESARGKDTEGYRAEFIRLVHTCELTVRK